MGKGIIKKLAVVLIALVFLSAVLIPAMNVRGDEFTNNLYLPLVVKDRGETIFGIETSWLNESLGSRAAEAQVTWMRINGLNWADIQPTKTGGYNWNNVTGLEQSLQIAAQRKLHPILIVRGTPSWAQKVTGSYCGPIKQENLADFAQFMVDVVKRYSVYPYNVQYFEIGNEPDVDPRLVPNDSVFGCWGNLDDPYYGGGYYAEMLKVVYPAIKSANPSAQVVFGGLLLDCDPRSVGTGYCPDSNRTKAPKFFEGALRNGGGAYFDQVSFHGYPTYSNNVSPIQSEKDFSTWKVNGGVVAGKIDYIKWVMSKYNVNKPIFHTEVALLLPNNTTPEQIGAEAFQQAKADYVVWLYARNWSLGVKGTTWYTLNGQGWRYGGLLDGSQNPLPAYYALKYMTETLTDYQYQQTVSPGNDTFGFEYKRGNFRIWIVFTPDKNPRVIDLPSGFSAAFDPLGNPVATESSTITISRPTYLMINP